VEVGDILHGEREPPSCEFTVLAIYFLGLTGGAESRQTSMTVFTKISGEMQMKSIHLKTINLAWFMLIVSFILYILDYLVFGRAGDVVSNFMGNLAFLPVYVLFVTLMVERVLKERDKVAMRQKLNMVIGVFYSEVGTVLLRDFTDFLVSHDELAAQLRVGPEWTGRDFIKANRFLANHEIEVDCRLGDLKQLKNFLMNKRDFMLGLLENPNLLEHEDFTDLLWAVFHLTEELAARQRLDGLPPTDLDHLGGDIRRVYHTLTRQWVSYMQHLKEDYPYLFSLAVRTNPMNPDAQVEVV
jgi:hypothetical protein